jgi:hypothetical protein
VKFLARFTWRWNAVFVPLKTIRFKLLGRTVRSLQSNEAPSDDWDLGRQPIEDNSKYISVIQHFQDGVAWEDTPIFRNYARRFANGEVIRRCHSVDELKEIYCKDMDRLYESLAKRGFLPHKPLPQVYIGRDGEIIFGVEGNHRLAIARILQFDEIPCRVMRRHVSWENLRRELAKEESRRRELRMKPELALHPDLRNVF